MTRRAPLIASAAVLLVTLLLAATTPAQTETASPRRHTYSEICLLLHVLLKHSAAVVHLNVRICTGHPHPPSSPPPPTSSNPGESSPPPPSTGSATPPSPPSTAPSRPEPDPPTPGKYTSPVSGPPIPRRPGQPAARPASTEPGSSTTSRDVSPTAIGPTSPDGPGPVGAHPDPDRGAWSGHDGQSGGLSGDTAPARQWTLTLVILIVLFALVVRLASQARDR